MGWGTQGYYLDQPGRFTVAEAFFANNQALLSLLVRIEKGELKVPAQFLRGLLYDRDVFVLYGDPAWQNALAEQESGWAQTLKSEKTEDGRTLWTLTIEPKNGAKTFNFDASKGSEYNNRPFVQLFPNRVADPKVVSGAEFNPVVVDNFILVPQSEKSTTGEAFTIQVSTR
jgi:zinc protease